MAAAGRVTVPPGDPDRTYTPDEEARLTRNLHALLDEVHRGSFSERPINIVLLRGLHQAIFQGVRSYAGRCRGPDYGSEHLTFGPHRSTHRDDVPRNLDELFEQFNRTLASLEANSDDPNYELVAIQGAVWLHAQVIRIHPFEDGNGRSSRALMNCVLVRLGLRPVAIEVPKQEYIASLNHYFLTKDPDPLYDLIIRLYVSNNLETTD